MDAGDRSRDRHQAVEDAGDLLRRRGPRLPRVGQPDAAETTAIEEWVPAELLTTDACLTTRRWCVDATDSDQRLRGCSVGRSDAGSRRVRAARWAGTKGCQSVQIADRPFVAGGSSGGTKQAAPGTRRPGTQNRHCLPRPTPDCRRRLTSTRGDPDGGDPLLLQIGSRGPDREASQRSLHEPTEPQVAFPPPAPVAADAQTSPGE